MAKTVFNSTEDVPLRIFAGVKNSWTLEFTEDDGETPKDMSGYSFYSQVRDRPGGDLLADLVFDKSSLTNGVLAISLSKTASEDVGADSGEYDILQEEDADTTNVVRLFGGDVEIRKIVTVI